MKFIYILLLLNLANSLFIPRLRNNNIINYNTNYNKSYYIKYNNISNVKLKDHYYLIPIDICNSAMFFT